VKSPASLKITTKFQSAIALASHLLIVAYPVGIIIRVNKVIARIVRGVDIDQFHLARVALLEQLEHFEVVALDEEILRGIPIDGFFRVGAKGASAGRESELAGSTLAVPVETELLLGVRDGLVADELLEHIHIDRCALFTLCHQGKRIWNRPI